MTGELHFTSGHIDKHLYLLLIFRTQLVPNLETILLRKSHPSTPPSISVATNTVGRLIVEYQTRELMTRER